MYGEYSAEAQDYILSRNRAQEDTTRKVRKAVRIVEENSAAEQSVVVHCRSARIVAPVPTIYDV